MTPQRLLPHASPSSFFKVSSLTCRKIPMMKISRISTLGMTAVAALAIAACSPPGEVDSDIKIDNASTFENQNAPETSAASESEEPSADASAEPSAAVDAAAGEEVQFIDCVATPVTEPVEVSLDCAANTDLVSEITWESWDAEGAEGTGTRVTDGTEATEGEEVSITLSQPAETGNGLAFTQIEVDGELVTP